MPIATTLDALAAHYQHYRRLMDHWHAAMPGQILDVSYADLVDDTPKPSREKCWISVAWPYEADCVELDRNTAPVATLSSQQVREPIHQRALGEWQRYERQLSRCANAIGGLSASGFDPAMRSVARGHCAEHSRLR